MDTRQYEELFRSEAREHVSAINQHLLQLEQGGDRREAVTAIFRAVHTIKGMAATMGYAAAAELSHELETLLDALRSGRRQADPATLDLLFAGADLLEATVDAAVAGRDGEVPTATMLARLRALVAAPSIGAGGQVEAPRAAGKLVRIVIEQGAPLRGVRAFMAIQALRALGEVTAVEPPMEAIQTDQFDHDIALRLATEASTSQIEKTVLAVGDIALVTVGEDRKRRTSGSVRRVTPLGTPAVGGASVTPATPATPSAAVPPTSERSTRRHVRVDLKRLDTLMNVVGELVITRGRLLQLAAERRDAELEDSVSEASRLIGELRDEITASRLVPAWQVFDRFPRLVRDTARDLGKEVHFEIEGKDIELDRSMLDDLADSLVHLLKNSIDHGLESHEERMGRGKPRVGSLVLSAVRERSAAVVRVTDDGRGIDRARVLARAKRDKLVEESKTELTDDELLRILTRPGFSTAETVTNVSGRGVGIDAVHTRVRSLGGTIDVRSVEGQGTSVMIRLPLTLAIVRAVLARVGDETYAIPGAHVSETIEMTDDLVTALQDREVLRLRDDVLPLYRMRSLFGLQRREEHSDERQAVAAVATIDQAIILDLGDRRAALVVDDLLGQEEIVVKPFDSPRGVLPYFGGATLLADGSPALIVDVSALVTSRHS